MSRFFCDYSELHCSIVFIAASLLSYGLLLLPSFLFSPSKASLKKSLLQLPNPLLPPLSLFHYLLYIPQFSLSLAIGSWIFSKRAVISSVSFELLELKRFRAYTNPQSSFPFFKTSVSSFCSSKHSWSCLIRTFQSFLLLFLSSTVTQRFPSFVKSKSLWVPPLSSPPEFWYTPRFYV